MRWLLVFLLASPASAAIIRCEAEATQRTQPCRPPKDESDEIMHLLRAGMERRAALQADEDDERRLRKAISEGNSDDFEAWDQAFKSAEKNRALMKAAFEEAITKTGDYYGIHPKKETGQVHGGLLDGNRVSWTPAYQEEQDAVISEVPARPSSGQGPTVYSFRQTSIPDAPAFTEEPVQRQPEVPRCRYMGSWCDGSGR